MVRLAIAIAVSALLAALTGAPAQAQALKKLSVMPGPLIEGHAKFEADCASCHTTRNGTTDYTAVPNNLCLGCHGNGKAESGASVDGVNRDIARRQGFHGLRSDIRNPNTACKSCHTDHTGRDADIVGLDRELFDHNQTDFKLTGNHAAVGCSSCHAPIEKYRLATTQCSGCHSTIAPASFAAKDKDNPRKWRAEKTRDPHKGQLPDCASCHKDTSWKELKPFDHAKVTASLSAKRGLKRGGFVLVGQHKKAACATCHTGENYRNLHRTCFSCHKEQDKITHKGMFGTRCDICHGVKSQDWKQNIVAGANDGTLSSAIKVLRKAKFDHSKTKFPLVGKHETKAKCESCHKKTFKIVDRNCHSCHEKNDAHKGLLGKKCETCHSPLGFKKLNPPLRGITSLARAITMLKKDARFDHNDPRLTKFALIGNHKTKAKCESCHTKTFRKTPQNCYACHKKIDDTKGHKGRFGKVCEACHSPVGWKTIGGVKLTSGSLRDAIRVLKKAKFKHKATKISSRTWRRRGELRGPLRGRHRRAACKDCHKKTFKGTANKCIDCHRRAGRKEHGRAIPGSKGRRNPNCGRCHGFGGW